MEGNPQQRRTARCRTAAAAGLRFGLSLAIAVSLLGCPAKRPPGGGVEMGAPTVLNPTLLDRG